MATLLKSDGQRVEGVDISTLKEMQELVGGYIEIVYLPEGKCLIINEEGLLLGLPLNQQATELYGHPIVGEVIYAQSSEIN
jgi:hypothetical protein